MDSFSERLKELRIEKKVLQKDLAKTLNTTQSTVARWERNIQEPGYEILCKIADIFGVSTDFLLGRED